MAFTIELDCKDDGTIVVSAESAAEEGQEEQGATGAPAGGAGSMAPAAGDTDSGDSEGGQVCHSLKEAMVAVLKLYQAQGQASVSESDSQFNAGYKADSAETPPGQ